MACDCRIWRVGMQVAVKLLKYNKPLKESSPCARSRLAVFKCSGGVCETSIRAGIYLEVRECLSRRVWSMYRQTASFCLLRKLSTDSSEVEQFDLQLKTENQSDFQPCSIAATQSASSVSPLHLPPAKTSPPSSHQLTAQTLTRYGTQAGQKWSITQGLH
jgi:hypothetical protein